MTTTEIKTKVHDFLTYKLGEPAYKFGDDEDIFASGLVNSLMALELVTYLENNFAIAVEAEDLEIDNFRSVNVIAQFVQKKMGS